MAEKRGRHTDNPAVNRIVARLTDDEMKELVKCENELKMSRSDVLRRGIHIQYGEITKDR